MTKQKKWRNPAENMISVARPVEKEALEDFFQERLIND